MFGDCLTSIIDQLLEDVNRHPEKRKRLARILALDIATEETLRLLLLEGLLRDVATKRDLREVEERLQKQMEELRRDLWKLNERIDGLVKWMVGLLASIWLTLVVLLLPVILKMLEIVG